MVRAIRLWLMTLEKGQCVDIDHSSWDSHERGVETVEHSSVSGKDVSAVLNAQCAFEERFHKVAPCAEENDDKSKPHPLEDVHG